MAKINPQNISTTATYKKLFSYTKHYRLAFFIAVLANLLYAVVDAAFIEGMAPLIDNGLFKKDSSYLVKAPFFVVTFMAIRGVASFLSGYLMGWVGQHVVADLRNDVFKKYMQLPASFYDKNSSGDLISKITFNAEKIAATTTNVITVIVRETGFLIFVIVAMLMKSIFLTSLYLVVLPIIAVIINAATKRFKTASVSMQDAMGDITTLSGEAISGYRTVKISCGEEKVNSLVGGAIKDFRKKFMKMIATKNTSTPLVQFVAACGLAVVLYFSLQEVQSGNISPGNFTALIAFMMAMLRPLKQLTSINRHLQSGIIATQSLFDVLELESEADHGTIELDAVKGEIGFENVSIQFQGRSEFSIDNFSFRNKPGQIIAIVGSSGSGKSTLLNLMMRFYLPTSGSITLDGNPINDIKLKSLRRNIALVSQPVTLFNESIRNNLIFGLDRDVTDEELIDTLKKAHAWYFVEKLPNQLDESIGEGIGVLSGGQQQRIAIARALLRNSPILFLDEATSALDSESEEKIQKSLEAIMQGKTTFVIAHRLSTIRKADNIIVMEAGKLVEQGKHAELLEKGGAYARLHALQFGEEQS